MHRPPAPSLRTAGRRWYSYNFVEFLLKRRADQGAKTNDGNTPFDLTVPLIHKPIRNLLRAAQRGDWAS